jgi:iron(III) transport system permease protein
MSENSMTIENKPKPGFSRTIKKVFNSIKRYLSNPANVITVIFVVFLTAAVIYPLIRMILNSLIVQTGEAKDLNDEFGTNLKRGDFTFLYWPYLMFNKTAEGFSQLFFWKPLRNSVLMSLVACLIAVGAGGIMAFLVTRTNLPFKKFISTVFIFPYIMPSWSLAIFWTDFFKVGTRNEAGLLSGAGLLQAITGLQAPAWLQSGFLPIAIVMGVHYTPFAYILIGGILRNMDANLEEAAIVLKATRFKILYRITLPIVAPAMISTILLVFAGSISSYTVPYYLSGGGGESGQFISITMRSLLTGNSVGGGYVVATLLMVISVLILSINNWFTKSRRSFTTVSGKSGQISKIDLKWVKWVIAAVVIIFIIFFALVPLVSFFISSLEGTAGNISTFDWKYWFSKESVLDDPYIEQRIGKQSGLFFNKGIMGSFLRSIVTSLIVALICGTFGILIGYAVSHNRRGKLTSYVGTVSFLPYLIPALSFSAVFFSLMRLPGFTWLDGTSDQTNLWACVPIVVIVGGIKFIPFASRSGTNAMLQLSGEIEEAAIIVGVPWWKRMTRIIFPIQKASFMSGYLLPFISCMREYTLFVLITSNYTLATNYLGYLQNFGAEQLANGMNLFLVILVIGINFLANKVTGASIDKGIGG